MSEACSLLSLDELLFAVDGSLFALPGLMADASASPDVLGASDVPKKEQSLQFCFTSVSTDSRAIEKNTLFVPLIGEKCDGHEYVAEAAQKGASVILVQNSSLSSFEVLYKKLAQQGVYVIEVKNTMHALQKAAACYVRKFPRLQKIGITGSNGKTTAKECVAAVLSQRYNVIMNEGNFNSETGLPLSVFRIKKEHEIGVFELGMNRAGEIKELADVLFPQTALITNIGTAHIGILGSTDKIAEQKKQIFSNFTSECNAFVYADEPYKDFLTKGVLGTVHKFGPSAVYGIENVCPCALEGTSFTYKGLRIDFPLCGSHNFKNACAAVAIGDFFGLTPEQIQAGLQSVRPLFGRTEILKGDITVVRDCYNANPDSMAAAVGFVDSLEWQGKKMLILGDMMELGNESAAEHEKIASYALLCSAQTLVFVGTNFASCPSVQNYGGGKKLVVIPCADQAACAENASLLQSLAHSGDLVLIKASRSLRLERLAVLFNKGVKECA